MSGIYVHIPFCLQKCKYCNFYSSVNLTNIKEVIHCICKELVIRKKYLSNDKVETIYFGGGTPSLLEEKDLNKILTTIKNNFEIICNPEITIECNPINLSLQKVKMLKNIGINRLSIGVQTFNEEHLLLLGRIDTVSDIENAIKNVYYCKFKNVNLDIIFSIFGQTKKDLLTDLQKLIKIKPTHISAYCLSIEQNTAFDFLIKNKKLKPMDENVSVEYFLLIDSFLTQHGYIHYEISNYCLPGFESKHNSNYWNTEKKYLGVGPGAHSYNLISRQWNVSNNISYIESLQKNKIPKTLEKLTKKQKFYEYLLTGLRTNNGCNLNTLKKNFNQELNDKILTNLIENKLVIVKNETLILTTKGMLFSNYIFQKIIS